MVQQAEDINFINYDSASWSAGEWNCLHIMDNSFWSNPLCISNMKSQPALHLFALWTNTWTDQTQDDVQSAIGKEKNSSATQISQNLL
jgi:hypothetical protein